MNKFKKGPEFLSQYVGKIKSRMGTSPYGGGPAIFRGHKLHTELNNMGWVELYIFGITGRRFSAEQLRLMEAIWVYTSYPDVRIWNNRVAGLAGSMRSTGSLGIATALALSEASIYGCGTTIRAVNFLTKTKKLLNEGKTIKESVDLELKHYRNITGYGHPAEKHDERNFHLLNLAQELGLDRGDYLCLALEIEEFLLKNRYRTRINYAGIVCALCADMKLSSHEVYLFTFPIFLAGMAPCFIEASTKPEGILFPTSCADIAYEGHSRRSWKK